MHRTNSFTPGCRMINHHINQRQKHEGCAYSRTWACISLAIICGVGSVGIVLAEPLLVVVLPCVFSVLDTQERKLLRPALDVSRQAVISQISHKLITTAILHTIKVQFVAFCDCVVGCTSTCTPRCTLIYLLCTEYAIQAVHVIITTLKLVGSPLYFL